MADEMAVEHLLAALRLGSGQGEEQELATMPSQHAPAAGVGASPPPPSGGYVEDAAERVCLLARLPWELLLEVIMATADMSAAVHLAFAYRPLFESDDVFKRLYDRRWEPRGLLEPLGARDLSYRKLCATRHAFERACMQTLQRQSSMSPELMQHLLLTIPNEGIGTPQRPETAAACIRNMLQRNIGSRQACQLTVDPTGLRTRPYGLRFRDEYRVRPGLHVLEGDFHPSGGGGPFSMRVEFTACDEALPLSQDLPQDRFRRTGSLYEDPRDRRHMPVRITGRMSVTTALSNAPPPWMQSSIGDITGDHDGAEIIWHLGNRMYVGLVDLEGIKVCGEVYSRVGSAYSPHMSLNFRVCATFVLWAQQANSAASSPSASTS